MEKIDFAIIGAGVIGLSIAYNLSKNKSAEIVVFEKNDSFGQGISSRNSEVIHAGIYYPINSLKSRLCINGNKLLYEFCQEHSIPFNKCGKIIVATNGSELKLLDKIFDNAVDCGASGLKKLTEKEIKNIEPEVFAVGGIYSSESGILNTHSLMQKLFDLSKDNGVMYSFKSEVVDIKRKDDGYYIKSQKEEILTKFVINCAGLQSDKIAKIAGFDIEKLGYKIYYCKGDYFAVSSSKDKLKHLVYPVPHEKGYGLGVHATIDLSGRIRLGPDANYVDLENYEVDSNKLDDFYQSAKKYLPWLKKEYLMPDTSGIRPKIQGPDDSIKDFIINEESENGFPNFINLIGIESPGLTSCLAIADLVDEIID